MSQVDGWYENDEGKSYTIVGCSRNACKIVARAFSFDGPWEIDEKYINLFDKNATDPNFLDQSKQPNKRKKDTKKFRLDVFNKTSGLCYYCGVELSVTTRTIDHFIPEAHGGKTELSNLVPCCKACNSSKGIKNIEDFRFLLQMKSFKIDNNVEFNRDQINFLLQNGFEIDLPKHRFWFELNDA